MDEETKEELTEMGFAVQQWGYSGTKEEQAVFIDVGLANLPGILFKLGVLDDYTSPLFIPSLIAKHPGNLNNYYGLFKYMLINGNVGSTSPPKLPIRDLDSIDIVKMEIWDREKERINTVIKTYLESKLILDRK